MTEHQIKTLAQYADLQLSREELEREISVEFLRDYDTSRAFLDEALDAGDDTLVKAACAVYWLYEPKSDLEPFLNHLILNPGHYQHQRLLKHLQDDCRYASAVPFIKQALDTGFDYLHYTGSEDAVIAKWFSHALHAIGTPEAIDLLKEYAGSPNRAVRDEMRYRLLRGGHWEKIGYPAPGLALESYETQQAQLPASGRHFCGQEQDGRIIFYAAFNSGIADYALRHQRFGGPFSFQRMTWIKPGFLWMMYRSGWAAKENQERILAIKLHKADVRTILSEAVLSSFDPKEYQSEEAWKNRLKTSNVRLQWDPDHDQHSRKLDRKAIQIGIKGSMLRQFNDEFIKEIEDITELVAAQRVHKKVRGGAHFLVPKERKIDFGSGFRIAGQPRSLIDRIRKRWPK